MTKLIDNANHCDDGAEDLSAWFIWPRFKCSRCGRKHCAELKKIQPASSQVIEAAAVTYAKRWAKIETMTRESDPEWYDLELSKADFATDAYVNATQTGTRWELPNTITTSNTATGYVFHCVTCP